MGSRRLRLAYHLHFQDRPERDQLRLDAIQQLIQRRPIRPTLPDLPGQPDGLTLEKAYFAASTPKTRKRSVYLPFTLSIHGLTSLVHAFS
jgi:hypothetical protein